MPNRTKIYFSPTETKMSPVVTKGDSCLLQQLHSLLLSLNDTLHEDSDRHEMKGPRSSYLRHWGLPDTCDAVTSVWQLISGCLRMWTLSCRISTEPFSWGSDSDCLPANTWVTPFVAFNGNKWPSFPIDLFLSLHKYLRPLIRALSHQLTLLSHENRGLNWSRGLFIYI